MTRQEILQAFEHLGNFLERDFEITIARGAALIVAFHLERGTIDVDALHSFPKFDEEFRRACREAAEYLELSEDWINDSAKGFADILPTNFLERRVLIGTFKRLKVYSPARKDIILLKLFAMRAQDVEDLQDLAPTLEELDFVRAQLDRVERIRPDRALAIQLYLEQGEGQL